MSYRLPSVANLKRTLGRYDAVVEFTEVAIRTFIDNAESSGLGFNDYLQSQASSNSIKVHSIDQSMYRSRISQGYIAAVYQATEIFLYDFVTDFNDLYDSKHLLDGTSEDLLTKVIMKVSSMEKAKQAVGEERLALINYYRLVRNKYSHDKIKNEKLAGEYSKLFEYRKAIKSAYPNLKAPNEYKAIEFDDFLLFTRVVKDIALALNELRLPTNDDISGYYLRKQLFKSKRLNQERWENALIGHMRTTFGIERTRAKEIAKEVKKQLR